jgi:general stress protein YciG
MPNSNRGFAAMDPEEQRRIASKGGRAAHESGHAHEWNSGEAAEAGRRGGLASHGERAAFHHESAAHHHAQAARYRASGEHDRADLHAEHARHHGREADEAGDRARANASANDRGFAAMDPERQREVASDGRRASHGGRSNESEGGREEDYQTSGRNGGSRGGSREQHQEAGRRGAEARLGRDGEGSEDERS